MAKGDHSALVGAGHSDFLGDEQLFGVFHKILWALGGSIILVNIQWSLLYCFLQNSLVSSEGSVSLTKTKINLESPFENFKSSRVVKTVRIYPYLHTL